MPDLIFDDTPNQDLVLVKLLLSSRDSILLFITKLLWVVFQDQVTLAAGVDFLKFDYVVFYFLAESA